MSERGQRTEKATPQRLKKAREEGKYPVSKEFVSAVQFLVLVALLLATENHWSPLLLQGLRSLLRSAITIDLNLATVRLGVREISLSWILPVAITALIIVAISAAAQLAVTGFGLASAKLAPDFSRLDPVSRLSDLPKRNLSSFGQAILFFIGLCYIGWKVYEHCLPDFLSLPYQSFGHSFSFLNSFFGRLLLSAAAVIAVWGIIDLFRQRQRYAGQLKMTKQEVKEEWRQNEGSPEIKMRIRRLRHELLRRRMMAEVPKASTVIVNPTHFSVALRYEHLAMAAPKVVAKGKNILAIRIRDIARQYQIPIIENPPLAQALYKNCQVGEEIPENLYKAVAEVLAYVFRLLHQRR